MRPILLIFAPLAALALIIQPGCDGKSGPIDSGNGRQYRIQGIAVKDANLNDAISVAVKVTDDTTISGATLRFSGDLLTFNSPTFNTATGLDSVYSRTDPFVTALPSGTHYLNVSKPGSFSDSAMTAVSDTFSITTVTPFNRIVRAGEQATLEWSTTPNVNGYVLAAVKVGKLYQQMGYSAVVSAGVNSGTIPPDAFLSADSLTPDTGLYHLYVYAYYGAPDSAMAGRLLPTPFPFQGADDIIGRENLGGRFGTVTVTAYDTVRVMLTK